MDKTNSYLHRFVIRPCLAIMPFLVFFVVKDSTYSPYVAARSIAFRLLAELLLLAWIVVAVRDRNFRPKRNPLVLAFAAFLVIQMIAAVLGQDFNKSFWGTLLRMEGLVTYFHLFAYIVVLSSVLNSRAEWYVHWHLHVAAGFFFAVLCVIEWSLAPSRYRVESLLGNPIYAATYSYFIIFISGLLLIHERKNSSRTTKVQVYLTACCILNTLVIFLTGTRGAMLGLAVGIVTIVLLGFWFFKEKPKARRLSVIILLLMTAPAIILFTLRDTSIVKDSPLLNRITSASPGGVPAKIRMASWKAAVEGAKERPLTGWGTENFQIVMSRYFDPFLHDQTQWYDRAHNTLLDWLVAGGIPGLVTYILLILTVPWLIWKRQHKMFSEQKIILTGLLVGYLIQQLFAFDSIMSLVLWGTVAAFVISSTEDSSKVPLEKPAKEFSYIAWAVYLIVTFTVIFSLNFSIAGKSFLLARASGHSLPAGPTENLSLFRSLLNSGDFGRLEIIEELFNFVTTGAQSTHLTAGQRAEQIGILMNEFNTEIHRRPPDPRILWFAARTRIEIGDYTRAIAYLNQAREIAPRMPILISTLAQAHLRNNDYLNTERELAKLYELTPGSLNAKLAYAEILRLNRKKAESEQLLRR